MPGRLVRYAESLAWRSTVADFRRRYDVHPTFDFRRGSNVYGAGRIRLGARSYIGNNTYLQGAAGATLTVGDPTDSEGLELQVIAAVVIGGGSLSGGEGSVLGSLIGAFLMAVIRTGAIHLGLRNWVQEVVTGAIIVIAVAVDRVRARSMAT